MTLADAMINVLGAVGVLVAMIYCGYRVVGWARKQKTGAYFFGALFAPLIAAGKVTDPDSRVVMEAKRPSRARRTSPAILRLRTKSAVRCVELRRLLRQSEQRGERSQVDVDADCVEREPHRQRLRRDRQVAAVLRRTIAV